MSYESIYKNAYWEFTTDYVNHTNSNGTVVTEVIGSELDLLKLVLEQMNMAFILVPIPEDFELEKGLTANLIGAMLAKETYIALGEVGMHYLFDPFLDCTNSYHMMRIR